jgi:hypothetical protein
LVFLNRSGFTCASITYLRNHSIKALNIPPGVGGNVVVAQGPVTVQGEHIFRVYKCPWFRVWREIAGGFGKWRAREDSNL